MILIDRQTKLVAICINKKEKKREKRLGIIVHGRNDNDKLSRLREIASWGGRRFPFLPILVVALFNPRINSNILSPSPVCLPDHYSNHEWPFGNHDTATSRSAAAQL
jgi:hypothetical protein